MVMLTREKRALWNLSPKRQQPRKDNNNQISSNDYLRTKFFLKIAGKTNGKKTVTLLTRQQNPIFLSSSVGYGLMLSFYVMGL
jgi:hypothetical protein